MISPQFFHALVLLNLLFVCGAVCLVKPSWISVAAVTVAGVLWVLFNGPIEGRVLFVLTSENGVTESDLLAIAGWVIAALGVWRIRTRRT
ncbi:hypothetical protein [Antrihabitans stalactiti]|uniref:Uncharacterized protein n=1 Tax=Antrihabitans stalactiti TaxID=2584121 RepID=A0A848KIZ1_9NOCA|nr:hypothetical protein [Antrihabitans stalactiti]